jgi:pimeloyl-ACP methyl ester carboxylesterase
MPVLKANDIHIAYEIQGSGLPLVLISGVGYGAWFWHKIVPDLSQKYQVITFDNRGAGGSDKPVGPYSVSMMAADTAGLMDALGIARAAVMGHSLGGFIAQELIHTRPELVDKLILASTNHGGMNVIPITPAALEVLTNREGDPLELVRRGIEIACAPEFAARQLEIVQELIKYRFTNPVPPLQYQAQVAAGAGMAALTDVQVDQRLAAIQVPTLILFGEFDQVVPPGNADLMVSKIANAHTKIIPATGHIFPIEDQAATVNALIPFLSSEARRFFDPPHQG